VLCCAAWQAKGKELLSLTDKLVACEAEVEVLRKQTSSLTGQLESAQAKVAQQAAAMTAMQEAHSKQQVGLSVRACLQRCCGEHSGDTPQSGQTALFDCHSTHSRVC
jgi:phage-related tail protein